MSIYRRNRTLRIILVSLLVLTLVGGLALQAIAAEKHKGPSRFRKIWMRIWRVLNFLILAYFLIRLLRQPLTRFFKERARLISEQIRTAEEACAGAERELREAEQRLEMLAEEIRQLQEAIGEHGERERKRIIAEARQAADQILERARLEAVVMMEEARSRLRREVIEMAVNSAEQRIRDAISPGDQQRLVKEYLRQLGQLSPAML